MGDGGRMSGSSKAMVTLVMGDEHRNLWQSLARPSWERFAARHGYEMIVLDRPLDDSPPAMRRSLTWQKLLAPGHPRVREFDRVLWIDSDILIHDAIAPCPIEQTPTDRIGAVPDQALLSHPSLAIPFSRVNHWNGAAADLARAGYRSHGIEPPADFWFNSGVLTLSAAHRELLEEVYRAWPISGNLYDEQFPLSNEILRRGLYHPLDPRFNQLWLDYKHGAYGFLRIAPAMMPLCIAMALRNCFFLHFAGRRHDMSHFDPKVSAGDDRFDLPPEYVRRVAGEWSALANRVSGKSVDRGE